MDEKLILQVLAEQKEYVENYQPSKWVDRNEERLFEFDSTLAQVIIGVRRSGNQRYATRFSWSTKSNMAMPTLTTTDWRS